MTARGGCPADPRALRRLEGVLAAARSVREPEAVVPCLAALGAGVVIAKAQTAGREIILFLLLFCFAAVFDAHLLSSLVDLLLRDLPQLLPLIVVGRLLFNAAVVLLLLVLDELLEDAALLELLSGDNCNLRHGRQGEFSRAFLCRLLRLQRGPARACLLWLGRDGCVVDLSVEVADLCIHPVEGFLESLFLFSELLHPHRLAAISSLLAPFRRHIGCIQVALRGSHGLWLRRRLCDGLILWRR